MKLLKELNKQYGPDTVSLLSWLNDASIRSESVLTATVGVSGEEAKQNATFLVFRVETGIIFNTRTTDQAGRLAALWHQILERAFSRFETIKVPADGVVIDLLSHCKSFAEIDSTADHIDEPGPVEEVKFYFLVDPLRAYLDKKLTPQALLARSQVFVDGVPVTVTLPEGATETKALPALSPLTCLS